MKFSILLQSRKNSHILKSFTFPNSQVNQEVREGVNDSGRKQSVTITVSCVCVRERERQRQNEKPVSPRSCCLFGLSHIVPGLSLLPELLGLRQVRVMFTTVWYIPWCWRIWPSINVKLHQVKLNSPIFLSSLSALLSLLISPILPVHWHQSGCFKCKNSSWQHQAKNPPARPRLLNLFTIYPQVAILNWFFILLS